ncbi:hypothetical protein A2867_03505 [Candidatus Daviesbacteria bacterium RIFCSPHIGHO2_01_FULL_40_11]|uniref:Uncharacterized protein n=1 Tax=Candidatus Daviesbacteria bacterium RIFCSPHIGHO2_01_FULL_40_11 TaxID=1797762 RepID=A0A1F5JK71_9BACT|nr:MAG: hypothetical protein A2867_03505 [Candidatus Daviesbacteria bacterium RIFCSPHIGHO2_01_FULL_40_11]OGE62794.1 MAG: hypothetical protein A2964_01770 [Candidatus Daviesbacteria bacterium RIFCSPLOWO2_01_FULL_40_27]
MIKKLFIIFSGLLLVYMIWPGPSKISDFAPLPSSDKSTLEGDTIQVPNVAGYFSNNFRDFVVPFYSKVYQDLNRFPFPPLRLNRPPEYSWIAIKKHTDSTYLEELVYPLRDSLFVNGFEPFYSDGQPKFWGATKVDVNGHSWYTKTTLRYYPSKTIVRIIVWFGVITSIYLLFKLGKKILI